MPIEIKELHIKVVVNASKNEAPSQAQPKTGNGNKNSGVAEKDAIIAECVEQVLQILQRKTER